MLASLANPFYLNASREFFLDFLVCFRSVRIFAQVRDVGELTSNPAFVYSFCLYIPTRPDACPQGSPFLLTSPVFVALRLFLLDVPLYLPLLLTLSGARRVWRGNNVTIGFYREFPALVRSDQKIEAP